MSKNRLRVGAVNYLNTKPLIYQLDRLAPRAEIVLDLPSRLADELAAGRLDVALIPSLEFFQRPDYRIVSDACIACRGPVLSVKLFSRVPIGRIGSLALDEGSRTSAALVRILLRQQFGLEPRLEPLAIGATLDDTPADAVLLIGDRAIHSPPGRFAEVWDLGDQWIHWSGLPMVFAMWTARADAELGNLESALGEARDFGVAHVAAIAAAEAAPLGLTVPQCAGYLRDTLHFYLGSEERGGLREFYTQAVALGFALPGCELASGRFRLPDGTLASSATQVPPGRRDLLTT